MVASTPAVDSLTLSKNDTYDGLHFGQRDVAATGLAIVPTDPPVTWRIEVTRPGGGNLTADPVTKVLEVEDLMLVLGYAWQ